MKLSNTQRKPVASARFRARRGRAQRRHGVLALMSMFGLTLLALLMPSSGPLHRWGVATAYTALAFLAATLLVGPFNVLLGRRNPVSSDLRRDLGLWSALHALVHSGFGLCLHGEPLTNFIRVYGTPPRLGPRLDALGLANYAGLAALGLLALLSVLSNDRALSRLKARRWKGVQRWVYLAFALTLAHGLTYLLVQGSAPGLLLAFVILSGSVIVFQGLGVWQRRGYASRSKS